LSAKLKYSTVWCTASKLETGNALILQASL
jgi:hypothetical protein